MKKLLIGLLLSVCFGTVAQTNINLTPMPVEMKPGKGNFNLNRNTVIVLEGSNMEKTVSFFNNYLQRLFGYQLKVVRNTAVANAIRLNYERLDNELPGAYNLTVDKDGIYIAGDNEEGVFYGMQTLIQLIPVTTTDHRPTTTDQQPTANGQQPTTNIPYVAINDHPRFAYRGMHLDVSRHLFTVDFIKKYIDFLAAYKYNTFHWHLTDDQGWRIEIKKYPLLPQVGSCRAQTLVGNYGTNKYDGQKYCGYYTQQQIKEIVKYAADRYITIIPEIEMPGHAVAALASYPYLGCNKGPYKVYETWGVSDDVFCAGNDSTYVFLQNVLDEVIQLFPSKYIHIGGDECPKERWKTCPVCQQRMKTEKLKDEHELQSYFIRRIEKYLNSKGRQIIGWDEILEGGLAPNATVMSWQGEDGGIAAARLKHDVIMTPDSHCYLNNSQSKNEDSIHQGGYLPLEKVYNYEPVPAALHVAETKYILGAQGNLWTEYITNTSKVEYMIFPRMIALSEVLWSPVAKRNWKDFERRLPGIFDRLDFEGVNYSKAYYDMVASVLPNYDKVGVQWQLETKNKGHQKIRVTYPLNEQNLTKVKLYDSLGNYKGEKLMPAQQQVEYPLYNNGSFIKNNFTVDVKNNGTAVAELFTGSTPMGTETVYNEKAVSTISQKFFFNKATGKKITLANEPSKNYPGDGPFTLVNGVQNEKGFAKSSEFLGFLGKDLDATIDLGKEMEISKITLHTLNLNGSWIYLPDWVDVSFLPDPDADNKYRPLETFTRLVLDQDNVQVVQLDKPKSARYIRVVAKNIGIIPSGKPGAGNPAWLFVDEIEVE